MIHPTVILRVEVELDMVPGWGNTGEDYQKHVQQLLDSTIPHYHPVVTIERYGPTLEDILRANVITTKAQP